MQKPAVPVIGGIAMVLPLLALAEVASGATGEAIKDNGIVLARDGVAAVTIVQADDATKPEALAVRELDHLLGRVTGASFPIAAESSFAGKGPAIFVGWTRAAAENGIEAAKLAEEEWILRTVPDKLILTGGRPRGTLYAVYQFLQKQVGCYWLDFDAEIVPSRPTLVIAGLQIRGEPFVRRREILIEKALRDDLREKHQTFRIRNKENPIQSYMARKYASSGSYPLTGGKYFVHSFPAYVSAEKWFQSHPEYFSLNRKGDRVPAAGGSGPGQLCLTNPDVRRLTLESLRKYISADRADAAKKGWPPPRIYNISQTDKPSMCMCPNCQAVAAREGSESGPLVEFINAIAEAIEREYPDVLIETLSYQQTAAPPRSVKPRHNVIIGKAVGGDRLRPLSHPYNAEIREWLVGWSKITTHLAIWDYWVPFGLYSCPTPFSAVHRVASNVKLYADLGARQMFVESQEHNEQGENFAPLKHWLGYQLMVEPSLPVEPLIRTFMEGYYGAAAPNMQEYLAYLEARMDKEAGQLLIRNAPYRLEYLDLDFFVKAERLFDEAAAAVRPESPEALHVQRERLRVDGALLYLWPWLDRRLAPDRVMPFDHQAVVARYEAQAMAQLRAYGDLDEKPNAAAVKKPGTMTRRERIAAQVAVFRNPELPEPFRRLPPRDVADFNWLTFSRHVPRHEKAIVADPDAAGGRAQRFVGQDKDHREPLAFGITTGPTVSLNPQEVPQDGKYHLFKIGRKTIKKGMVVWGHASYNLGVKLDWPGIGEAQGPKANTWDVYISLKVKGPAYVRGSTDRNEVWMDRVLLVKPQ